MKGPPTFLVTTPESLYLLVTAERSRAVLGAVETVIVDEIHALARDKRGTHLALTLERLEHLQAGAPPQRVGLSATQRPIEATARLLVGAGSRASSHHRRLRARPRLETVSGASRQRARRGGLHRADGRDPRPHRRARAGPPHDARFRQHAADVGTSGARARRAPRTRPGGSAPREPFETTAPRPRNRLRAGDLRALVATASLELGIDIGPVELVCQVGSPRSIATFLQRVGRSNHSQVGSPEGVLYPMTRDELVECAAPAGGGEGRASRRHLPPIAPLDILAQQIIAEVAAAEEWKEDELYELMRRAAPY